ncbi:REPEAT-CONTAINING PROTEIN putative-RELATED, partial [Salix purpurea]
MVDLLSRAGHLDCALQLIKAMPFKPGEAILGALLSACIVHQDLEVGERVVKLVSSRVWLKLMESFTSSWQDKNQLK